MHFNIKKAIIILLSSLISLGSACNADTTRNDSAPFSAKAHKQTKKQNLSIYNTVEWRNISNYWKKIDQTNQNDNFNALVEVYKKLEEGLILVKADLETLYKQKYLNENQYNYLNNEIGRKLLISKRNNSMITCYEATSQVDKREIIQSDLEQRYETIEKLFQEGKINTETFEITSKQILEDLQDLYKLNNPDSKEPFDATIAELMINLNK